MEAREVREKLEQSLDSQDLDYSLDLDLDDENITVAISYRGNSFPTIGSELDELVGEDEYEIARGEIKPETGLPEMRSRTFTLRPTSYK